jgi:asparagine synthase (glutamine-hydrolysing)
MCGITGGVWTDAARALEPETLRRMTAVLRHRGPDDEGQYRAELRHLPGCESAAGVALGHRRLAIIDVGGGHQPLSNEDGTIWIVFNGEIYNYPELRRRLEGAGHCFRTSSDTETVVHLYEQEGPRCIDHLQGMFALAIWDARQQQLLLARDRLGEKPLVYREEPGRLLFASELKSLLEVPGVPRDLDPQSLDAYLTYQYVPHPRTIFRGIHKLPPGHLAIYAGGRLEVRRYWNPDFSVERPQSRAWYVERLRELLTSAVAARLQSEVPLGAFLSGGIDSSIIVGLAQRLTGRLRTFSIGFSVPEYDETRYARLVARHFQTEHEEFQVRPDAVTILPKLVEFYDEPFGDSSAVPTWYLSELARRKVTVALTGDGGDELFAGYPRYQAVWLAGQLDRLPAPLRLLLRSGLWQHLPQSNRQKSLVRRWKRFAEALGDPPPQRYLQWIAIFNEARRAALYSDELLAALPDADPADFLAGAMARSAGRDAVTAASLADATTYLPCDLLTKVDVASMAHGLECRPPLLDHRVVELAAAMPVGWKFRYGRGKRILREAFADLLPKAILRRPKMGFGVPLAHWFRNELKDYARDVLLDPAALGRGYFRPAAVRQLLDEHQSGRFDHSYRLWAILVLEQWQRRWGTAGRWSPNSSLP